MSMPPGSFNPGRPDPAPFSPVPPPFPPPDRHWGLVLVAFVLCWPIGYFASRQAALIDFAWAAGDWEGGRRASAKAARLAKIGVVVGLVAWGWLAYRFFHPARLF